MVSGNSNAFVLSECQEIVFGNHLVEKLPSYCGPTVPILITRPFLNHYSPFSMLMPNLPEIRSNIPRLCPGLLSCLFALRAVLHVADGYISIWDLTFSQLWRFVEGDLHIPQVFEKSKFKHLKYNWINFFFNSFISNQNYFRFYKLICWLHIWLEEAYPMISPH
jgi:hypothetical protein